MKIFKIFLITALKRYRKSYVSVHVLLFLIATILSISVEKYGKINIPSNEIYVEVLNGIGILTSFLILVIDKLNFNKLIIKFPTKVRESLHLNKSRLPLMLTEGEKISNTIFSILISTFTVLGISYLCLLFGYQHIFLVVSSSILVFTGFIICISVWSVIEVRP